jgi:hypothetical protein
MVGENRRITVDDIAEALNISHGSADRDQIQKPWKTSKARLLVAWQRPSSDNQTVETVNELRFELLEQSPFSPDLASSYFHMFGPMKEALRGGRFSSDEEVIGAVQNRFKDFPVLSFLTKHHAMEA